MKCATCSSVNSFANTHNIRLFCRARVTLAVLAPVSFMYLVLSVHIWLKNMVTSGLGWYSTFYSKKKKIDTLLLFYSFSFFSTLVSTAVIYLLCPLLVYKKKTERRREKQSVGTGALWCRNTFEPVTATVH